MLAIIEYEAANAIPAGYINFAIAASSPNGAWQKLERNEIPLDNTFYKAFSENICSAEHWATFHQKKARKIELASPPPKVDGETLFWRMMAKGQQQDAVVIDAIKKLRASGRYVLGALTNDYALPPDHPYSAGKPALKGLFDVWVASSEVGTRKPEEGMYREAMKRAGVTDGREVVFCDDIGQNLRAAKRLGWKTVKMEIGGSRDAVRQLERITGLHLLEEGERSRL